MKRSVSYHKSLIKALQDPAEAAEYLNAALHEGDSDLLLVALRNVTEAQGGMSKLARRTKLNRANLYQILSPQGNPRIHTLENILKMFGLQLAIVPEQKGLYHRAA